MPYRGMDELSERRRRLLEFLAGRGATQAGFAGLGARAGGSAVGRTAGIGGRAGLPGMTYNPFFSQIAGRPGEQFQNPAGIDAGAAAAVQAGTATGHGLVGGPPGLGGMPPGPPQIQQPAGGAAGRNLVGMGAPPPPLQQGLQQGLQQAIGGAPPALSPYIDPRLIPIGTRGIYRS